MSSESDLNQQPPSSNIGEVLWTPSAASIEDSHLNALINTVGKTHPDVVDFDSLYHWSVTHTAGFWESVWDYCGVISSKNYDQVLRHSSSN